MTSSPNDHRPPQCGPNISTKAEAPLFIEKVEHYHPEQLFRDDDP
jgi:hypothetical protein